MADIKALLQAEDSDSSGTPSERRRGKEREEWREGERQRGKMQERDRVSSDSWSLFKMNRVNLKTERERESVRERVNERRLKSRK